MSLVVCNFHVLLSWAIVVCWCVCVWCTLGVGLHVVSLEAAPRIVMHSKHIGPIRLQSSFRTASLQSDASEEGSRIRFRYRFELWQGQECRQGPRQGWQEQNPSSPFGWAARQLACAEASPSPIRCRLVWCVR